MDDTTIEEIPLKKSCDLMIEEKQSEQDKYKHKNKYKDKYKDKQSILIAATFIVGIVWTSLHPIVSVITGELKCRGWFTDESSLESRYFRYDPRYHLPPTTKSKARTISSSLCQALSEQSSYHRGRGIDCHRHKAAFELAKIEPLSAPITPRSEAIVLVVPFSNDWKADPFHSGVLHQARRFTTEKWVAKTFFILAPSTEDQSLDDTVDTFLHSYLDNPYHHHHDPLPTYFTTSLLRSILVFNVNVGTASTSTSTSTSTIRILPQGRRGLLPNMDMVFLMGMGYIRQSSARNLSIQMHPYNITDYKNWIQKQITHNFYQRWALELLDCFYFAKTQAVGPYPPHASALERGIDAITVQADLTHPKQAIEFLQQTEYSIRGLNNLHERLHHSLSQYWIPRYDKFVSHSEYLVPNILMQLPLVIRAVTLILFDIPRFDFSAISALFTVLFTALGFHVFKNAFENDPRLLHAALALLYGSLPFLLPHTLDGKSLHFAACLFAIYTTVPLILAHVSLAFPTSLLWSSVLAMLLHETKRSQPRQIAAAVVLFATWPPVFLIPQLFGTYTAYTTLSFIPTHLMAFALLILSFRSK